MSKVVAGIDVSKSSLDVRAAGGERCLANAHTSWRTLTMAWGRHHRRVQQCLQTMSLPP